MRCLVFCGAAVDGTVVAVGSERRCVGDGVAGQAAVGAVVVDLAATDVGADEHLPGGQWMPARTVRRRGFGPAFRDSAEAVVVHRTLRRCA